MENRNLKERVNELARKTIDFALTLRMFNIPDFDVKLPRNSSVGKFGAGNREFFVLSYKDIPIAFYDSDGDFYDLTDILYFRTKKTEKIIRKFQKEYAPNFSVYYTYRH